MSQDDPTGTPEERASENASRRRFLKGGAMAAMGALAAAVVPKAAEAQPQGDDIGVKEQDGTPVPPVSYHPNDTLASVIVNAWASPAYEAQLRNNPQGALAAAGISFAPAAVKVLTRAEYRTGWTRPVNQVIFVLPDRPSGLYVALDQARVMMAVTPFGM